MPINETTRPDTQTAIPVRRIYSGTAYLDTPTQDAALEAFSEIPTDLSTIERRYLAWAASQVQAGGLIIDLNCFLGASTDALLRGRVAGTRVLCFDRLRLPDHLRTADAQHYARYNLASGDSYADLFDQLSRNWSEASRPADPSRICGDIERGDITEVDLLSCGLIRADQESPELLDSLMSTMRPGSLMLLQSFFDPRSAWLPLYLWSHRHCFTPLDVLEHSPLVSFRCEQGCIDLVGERPSLLKAPAQQIEDSWNMLIEYWAQRIGPAAAEVFHGHAFFLAAQQGRTGDAIRHGRAYERWMRSKDSQCIFDLPAWPDELRDWSLSLSPTDEHRRGAASLAAESIARGPRRNETGNHLHQGYIAPTLRAPYWDRIEQHIRRAPGATHYLYGAGKHTRWLLSDRAHPVRSLIAGIIDDDPRDSEVAGVPVYTTQNLTQSVSSEIHLYPSSDTLEHQMLIRLRVMFPDTAQVQIVPVYTDQQSGVNPATAVQTDVVEFENTSSISLKPEDTDGIEHLPGDYPHREQLGLSLTRDWVATFIDRYRIPSWCHGFVRIHEAAFLWDLIEFARPQTLVEVGAASGVSSAMLLHALEHFRLDTSRLHSFDIASECYFDHSRSVGSAVSQMTPHLHDKYHLYTHMNAQLAAHQFESESIDLLFIDADHGHPAPSLDVLALLYACKPRSWIILHDIELHRLTSSEPGIDYANTSGAGRLFEAWPFEKTQPTALDPVNRNIGAIRLPENHKDAIEPLLSLLNAPWESNGQDIERARAARSFLDQTT